MLGIEHVETANEFITSDACGLYSLFEYSHFFRLLCNSTYIEICLVFVDCINSFIQYFS